MKLPSLRTLASAVAVTFAIGVPTQVSADHSWGGYHWARTANPFTLKIGNNVSAAWNDYLDTAIANWSQSTVLNLLKVTGSTTSRKCRAISGRVEVCNERYGNNGWLGIASIWTSGQHIVQGTTKLNDTYLSTTKYNRREWWNFVMCQEIGHTFGLGHVNENFSDPNTGSCMDYTSNPAASPNNEYPNAHDYEQLERIYDLGHAAYGGHLDSSTTVGQTIASTAEMPRHIAEHDADHPSQWGKLVSSKKNGQVQTYMLDFGRGYKIIRHVIWIEGRGHEHRE